MIISLNGTSRRELVESRLNVVDDLREALRKLGATAPHARDYVGDGDAYKDDQLVFRGRCQRLIALINELDTEAGEIALLPGSTLVGHSMVERFPSPAEADAFFGAALAYGLLVRRRYTGRGHEIWLFWEGGPAPDLAAIHRSAGTQIVVDRV